MIGDGGNSGFMGFGLLGLWVFGCLIFFFFVGFGCDCGLWLKWQFGGCVGGGLVAVGMVAVGGVAGCGCVGGGLIFFFFFLPWAVLGNGCGCVGGGHMKVVAVGCGCHMKVVTGGVCGCDNCV